LTIYTNLKDTFFQFFLKIIPQMNKRGKLIFDFLPLIFVGFNERMLSSKVNSKPSMTLYYINEFFFISFSKSIGAIKPALVSIHSKHEKSMNNKGNFFKSSFIYCSWFSTFTVYKFIISIPSR
jgi:hypothetical protein